MVKKRARLTEDNDPLSSTDKVLAGYEQLSQQAEKSESYKVNKSESQEVNRLASQVDSKQTSQEERKLEVQEDHERQDNKSSTQPKNMLTSQQDSKLTGQQVNKVKLRKSTFQLNEEVLDQLDNFYLQLRLELGKANTPYKEVIVEEAITRLLKMAQEDRDELVETLQTRQSQRK